MNSIFINEGKMVSIILPIYKKSLIDSANYKPVGISHGEDLCFNLQVLPHANKIVSIPQMIYFYRWGGMTNKINKNLFKDACTAYNFKLQMFKKHNSKDSVPKASGELGLSQNRICDSLLNNQKRNINKLTKRTIY